jgi:hypothetical protein
MRLAWSCLACLGNMLVIELGLARQGAATRQAVCNTGMAVAGVALAPHAIAERQWWW